jgi:hypothetical protein
MAIYLSYCPENTLLAKEFIKHLREHIMLFIFINEEELHESLEKAME